MAKDILEEISQIAERKLTRTEICTFRSLIAQLPTEKIDKLMCIINEDSLINARELSKLLLYSMSYRLRMPITEMYTYHDFQYGSLGFYLCPQCKTAIECDFQKYCGSCGQALSWDNRKKVTVHRAGEHSEAARVENIDEVECIDETDKELVQM